MTREEAIKILEQRFDASCRNNLFQNAEKLDYEDALWMAISALRSTPQPGKPLTLEQLREMDGQPVWIKSKRYGVRGDVVHIMGLENGKRYVRFEVNPYLQENGYGKTWFAYSYPPAQQRWIPVSERLPERRRCVLCRLSYPDIEEIIVENQYYGNGMWMEESEAVTHWMPLPEPPEEG